MTVLTDDIQNIERSLCERLMVLGKLDQAGLERAERVHDEGNGRLCGLLTRLGLVSERDLAAVMAHHFGAPLVTMEDLPATPIMPERLGRRFLGQAQVLPLREEEETVVVAMADPLDGQALNAVRLAVGKELSVRVVEPSILERALDQLYSGSGLEGEKAGMAAGPDEAIELDIERLKDLASEAPVVRMVDGFISRAVEQRASDIHIEPFEDRLLVRFRVDGSLTGEQVVPSRLAAAVASRVKIMAKLNIAERRLPQDGRVQVVARGKVIDLRVATMPTLHGETVVMRVLDRDAVSLDFKSLGVDARNRAHLDKMLLQPNGVFLVTGPTGSGKTTTLYAALKQLNSPDKKILTVEDPVEYRLDGVNQVQVKPSIGLSFATVLRAMLRHDPDIIMVGEIRDGETADIAVQAALTGHLVLSTLHTNNAASCVTRLIDMGIEDYLLASTLTGVVGQRLVRTLCKECRRTQSALPEVVEQLNLRRFQAEGEISLYHPVGCNRCNGTGFSGRTSVMEGLVMSEPLRKLLLKNVDAHELQRAAIEEGMITMFEDGVMKALAGETTLEEIFRVTHDV